MNYITQDLKYLAHLYVQPESLEILLLFTSQFQLETLCKFGTLVQMDSTHKLNSSNWKLTTIYVQNNVGVWFPGVQFFLSTENSALVTTGLNFIKSLAEKNNLKWQPRYFIIDDSNIETKAIKDCFAGLLIGEQEVSIFYCKVHLARTLMRKLSCEKKSFSLMLKAMNKLTRIGCEEVMYQAIEECKNQVTKTYLIKNWKSDTSKWGMWARQHSPLLLQNLSTNAIERYHREIKVDCQSSDSFKGK
jgi:hypothetical protein